MFPSHVTTTSLCSLVTSLHCSPPLVSFLSSGKVKSISLLVGGECNIDLNDFFDAEGNEEGSNGSGEDSNGSGEGSHEENKPPVFTGELPRRELLELDDHQIDEMVKKKIQTVEDDLFNKAGVDKLAATIMPDGQVHVVHHGSNDGKYTTNDLLAAIINHPRHSYFATSSYANLVKNKPKLALGIGSSLRAAKTNKDKVQKNIDDREAAQTNLINSMADLERIKEALKIQEKLVLVVPCWRDSDNHQQQILL